MVLSGFSRRHGYPRCRLRPESRPYFQVRLGGWTCLPPSAPTPFNLLFRQQAEVSLPRPRVARAASAGMLTGSSICLASRLIIRDRLTPGRLTSPGNPWSCGGGESHPSTSELLRTLWMNGCFQANMLAVMGKGLR